MVEFNKLQITPDGKGLEIDVSVKDLPYFQDVYLDKINIYNQDNYNGKPLYSFDIASDESTIVYASSYYKPVEVACILHNTNTYSPKMEIFRGDYFYGIDKYGERHSFEYLGRESSEGATFEVIESKNPDALFAMYQDVGSGNYDFYMDVFTDIPEDVEEWVTKEDFIIEENTQIQIMSLAYMAPDVPLLPKHYKGVEWFLNVMISFLGSQAGISMKIDFASLESKFQIKKSGVKNYKLFIKDVDILYNLNKDLLFIEVYTKGLPSPDTPCGLDINPTVGAIAWFRPILNKVLSYTKSITDKCEIPRSFMDFILLYRAFQLAVKTGNFKQAIKYWRMLFKKNLKDVITNKCTCHGR
jgi:hypothetical protein